MENSKAATNSTCSWATASGSGSAAANSSPYHQTTWLSVAPAGYDSNNNSSSCTNNESHNVGTDKKLRLATRASSQAVDLAQLAKTIGNEFRGEFIVLPHHLVNFDHGDPVDLDNIGRGGGDDDLSSNSEDCVYAYRGDQADLALVNGMGAADGDLLGDDVDDETDFLEMDFDPEPNSEQENLQVQSTNGRVDFGDDGAVFQVDLLDRAEVLSEWRNRNKTVVESSSRLPDYNSENDEDTDAPGRPTFEETAGLTEMRPGKSFDVEGDTNCNGDLDCDSSLTVEYKGADELFDAAQSIKSTGAIPKVKKESHDIPGTSEVPQHTPPPVLALPKPTSHVPVPPNSNSDSVDCCQSEGYSSKPEEVACLECSGLELLSQDGPSVLSHCMRHCKRSKSNETTIEVTENTKQIQICPNILDEENIRSFFELLGVELIKERLHEQVQANQLSLERTKTITEYLIRYTKANCDPRSFVRLVESCCPGEVFSDLDFHFQSVPPEFNVLTVPAAELMSRWSSEQGLRELGRVNNKRFQKANVLGKVANLIRLRGKVRNRDLDKVTSPLLVPTYYRPGILLISRRDHQT